MKKMRLDLDDLRVDSFITDAEAHAEGTVHGHISFPVGACPVVVVPGTGKPKTIGGCPSMDYTCKDAHATCKMTCVYHGHCHTFESCGGTCPMQGTCHDTCGQWCVHEPEPNPRTQLIGIC